MVSIVFTHGAVMSKNMLFSLCVLTTMMSFSTGYAADSSQGRDCFAFSNRIAAVTTDAHDPLKDDLKQNVLNKKDIAKSLACDALGISYWLGW